MKFQGRNTSERRVSLLIFPTGNREARLRNIPPKSIRPPTDRLGDLRPYPENLAFIEANPPDSIPTDISLSQFLAIQEKGVSAWEFEAELEIANCFVEARTEIEFYDSVCSVQSNLPVPKQNEVYYWEAKLYEKPENTLLSIGMSTKPYPMFRLPGGLILFSPVLLLSDQ